MFPPLTVIQSLTTTRPPPSCYALHGGAGVFELIRKVLQDENYQLCQKTHNDPLYELKFFKHMSHFGKHSPCQYSCGCMGKGK